MIKLIQDADGYTLAVLPKDSHFSTWIEQCKSIVHDQTVPLHILPLFKEGDTVVDIGANLGTHTVPYAKHVGPNGRVLAFEPYVPSFVCLAVNCRDLPQVELFNYALGNFHGDVSLQLPSDTNMGTVCVDKSNSGDTLVRRLDDLLLPRCEFGKIDAEGYEPNVILGALETIKRFNPILFIELNDAALRRYGFTKDNVLNPLFALGYTHHFYDPKHTLDEVQVDVIMKPA
ncbi:MAG: FkbM family methyltransferase [Pseudomonadota bacterium]